MSSRAANPGRKEFNMKSITERQFNGGRYCNSKERYVMCGLANGKITVQFYVADKNGKVIDSIEYPVKAIKTKPYFTGCDDQKHYLSATEVKSMNKMIADQGRINWNGLVKDVNNAFKM